MIPARGPQTRFPVHIVVGAICFIGKCIYYVQVYSVYIDMHVTLFSRYQLVSVTQLLGKLCSAWKKLYWISSSMLCSSAQHPVQLAQHAL